MESSTSAIELLSDEQLVSRALSGAKDAFDQLFRRYERRLFRFLSSNAANHADAEDALQQAAIKAYLNLQRYNTKWRFTTWLFTIALRELRSIARKPRMRLASLDEANQTAAAKAQDHSPGELWLQARHLLSSQQYAALWLRYGEDMEAREIAKVMKRPRVWVSVTLHRACAALRKAVAPASNAESAPLHRTARGVL